MKLKSFSFNVRGPSLLITRTQTKESSQTQPLITLSDCTASVPMKSNINTLLLIHIDTQEQQRIIHKTKEVTNVNITTVK
jgi:hypothetical protein